MKNVDTRAPEVSEQPKHSQRIGAIAASQAHVRYAACRESLPLRGLEVLSV
jgi:hypothetical protein